ncbi:conserved unknown protein [Ectocarpus siliculosus]|uniref:Uncharacterized protein n=1 Tax=Ectocarpus siliculosus TaxID=2880 RepID=D7FT43_ECTSI|nr:conserved unknown protein [Ectocarpus siliculosus]|eukprot:CBJ31334.1 conserved unknown protein [Ectocarpus siliculosus]
MDLLSDLIDNAEKTHSSLGKRPAPSKPQPQGDDLFQALAHALSALHQRLCHEPAEVRSNLEIEVRVGLISQHDRLERATPGIPGSGAVQMDSDMMRQRGLRFVSGVSAPAFDAVKEEVGRRYGVAELASKEVVYVYDSGQMRDQRVVADGVNPLRCERKEARQQVNFQLAAAQYDLRVQASLEQPVPPEAVPGLQPGSSEPPQGWSGRRTKRRFSFKSDANTPEDERWIWRADLTLVEEDDGIRKAVAAACAQLKRPTGKGSSFPGAQPVNMCKRNVPDVQRGSYLVAEKTDGVRYLMMAVGTERGATCVLVDRSMNVFRVTGGGFLAGIVGVGTILDGELVHNRTMKKAIFVAFDILRNRERNLVPCGFLDRLSVLQKEIIPAYVDRVREGGAEAAPDGHLMLVPKRFFPRQKIMDLFRQVLVEGQHRIFRDEERSLHHKTDGIIFQPDAPYKVGTDTALLKWKWVDLASVDLRAYPATAAVGGGGGVRLCSEAGNHGEEVDLSRTVHLSEHDQARLVADMQGSRSVIAEMALDPGSGLWVYMGLRPDKDRPNFITTVISTMVEVAEGLSEEELKYRMLAESPASDDWARQEMTMRKRAVQWQYKRKSTQPQQLQQPPPPPPR